MTLLLEMFTYPFIVRAFAAGVLLSLCAALLGVPLVLKRYSMIGDGLSHVSFGALSVALACGWAPLPVSIPVVIVAALGLLRMTERSRMGADAAIAVVSASSLAVGVIVTSLTTGMTTDVDSYMFGSILAMTQADVVLSALLCVGVLVLFVLFYHRLFAITFDENFSRATGVLSRYEPVSPTQKPSTDSTPASTTTPRKLFLTRMADSAGKITRLEMSIAPIIRIPSTMVKAVSTDSRVLYSPTFTPVAREKFSSKVMAKSLW